MAGNPNPNTSGLTPFDKNQSREKAVINGKKGAKKKKEKKKKKKLEEKKRVLFKDLFIELTKTKFKKANDPTKGKVFKALQRLFPELKESKFTHQTAMYVGLFKTAMSGGKGSVQAFNAIRDTMGEKPVDTIFNLNTELEIDDQDKEMLRETAKKYLGLK